MAYGKDPSVLDNASNFGESARRYEREKAKPSSGGGGSLPSFIDQFKPSKDEPDLIRIIPGQYEFEAAVGTNASDVRIVKRTEQFYPYVDHYNAVLKKGCICSAGILGSFKGKAEPCRACDQFWAEKVANRGTQKQPVMKRSDKYSFTVLHYAPYAFVEQTDYKTGAIRTNEQTGEPYMGWVRVHEYERAKFAGREMREAHVLHWDIGWGHYSTLLEINDQIGKSCRTCGGRNTIQMEAWTCTAPGCGEALIEKGTTYKPAEIKELTQNDVRCAHCQQVMRLKEHVSCTQCGSGRRADITNVDINVKRQEEDSKLLITEWSNPGPIDARFTDIAKPMDLKRFFTPTPVEEQIKRFGPWTGGTTRQPATVGSRPYGAK
jgi:hypothetical protein